MVRSGSTGRHVGTYCTVHTGSHAGPVLQLVPLCAPETRPFASTWVDGETKEGGDVYGIAFEDRHLHCDPWRAISWIDRILSPRQNSRLRLLMSRVNAGRSGSPMQTTRSCLRNVEFKSSIESHCSLNHETFSNRRRQPSIISLLTLLRLFLWFHADIPVKGNCKR